MVRLRENSVTDTIDLDAYFARIGYSGPRNATLETLRALHALHPGSIAFENLDPLMGRRVHLDMGSVQRKLVEGRRGGYCFEQNGLFAEVLSRLGFVVAGLSARVLMGAAPGTTRRSHMLLKVSLPEGDYIADVGFGSRTLSAPLRLRDEAEQETPNGPRRVLRAGGDFDLSIPIDGEWKTIYRFSLEEHYDQDYEVANWYTSTHPDSPFTKRLMAARTEPERMLGLLDNQFAIHRPDGTTERRQLKNAGEIADVLEREFGICLPTPREELMGVLARLVP